MAGYYLRHLLQPLGWIAAAMLITAVVSISTRLIPFLSNAENWSSDLRIATYSPGVSQNRDIIIVSITEETLATLKIRSPIDREFLKDILNYLSKAGVKAVGLDILFDQPTERDHDKQLQFQLGQFPAPLVAAYAEVEDGLTKEQATFLNGFLTPAFRGLVRLARNDSDSVVRDVYTKSGGSAHMGFAALIAKKLGAHVPDGLVPISFISKTITGDPAFASYPAHTVKILPKEWFAGKIVLIGVDLPHSDRVRTPLAAAVGTPKITIPGVMVHAHALAQFLENRNVSKAGWLFGLSLVFVCTIFGLLIGRLSVSTPLQVSILFATIVGIWGGGISSYFYGAPLIPLVAPTLGFAGSAWLGNVLTGSRHRKEKKFIRQAFSHFVSPAIVQKLVSDPTKLNVGGEKMIMTLVFTDIKGFTTLSERLDVRTLVPLLNEYLDGMSRIILDHEGTIDKFVGDAVMAFFGAPTPQEDHAERAVNCALRMAEFSKNFAEEQEAAGIPFGMTRIGVHTGPAIVGNVGGTARFDYTAIGDTVNTAARLEGANGHLGTWICVSGPTVGLCKNQIFRPIGNLVLKGKTEPLAVFEPLFDDKSGFPEYIKAYECLSSGDKSARELFRDILEITPNDELSRFHFDRLSRGETGTLVILESK
jgi:adenylate cyclase